MPVDLQVNTGELEVMPKNGRAQACGRLEVHVAGDGRPAPTR
jgi:hypothetical protein